MPLKPVRGFQFGWPSQRRIAGRHGEADADVERAPASSVLIRAVANPRSQQPGSAAVDPLHAMQFLGR
jgi:hypothetical protein